MNNNDNNIINNSDNNNNNLNYDHNDKRYKNAKYFDLNSDVSKNNGNNIFDINDIMISWTMLKSIMMIAIMMMKMVMIIPMTMITELIIYDNNTSKRYNSDNTSKRNNNNNIDIKNDYDKEVITIIMA